MALQNNTYNPSTVHAPVGSAAYGAIRLSVS